MISDKERFDLSGPSRLIGHVDWNNVDHRRSIVACLVQGVKIQELDRQENRQGPQALARRWWESFGFRLHTPLIDADHSIFGAIYKFTPPIYRRHFTMNGTPRYIIAFRGTLTKGDAFLSDIKLDVQIIKSGLHQTPRFEIAMQSVEKAVADFGNSNIWLTGHSLGAAMAMLAGKTMAKTGIFLETFLFNLPFVSAHIGRIKNEKVQQVVRNMRSKAVGRILAWKARRGHQQQTDVLALSEWVPHLYVHPDDHVCSEYIGYFGHRETMEEEGVWSKERLATQHSLRVLMKGAIGMKREEPFHLIPSADLIVNLTPAQAFIQAHGLRQWWRSNLQAFKQAHELRQWWRSDLQLQSTVYKYNN